MKTGWTSIIIIVIIFLSGCTGAVEPPQKTITATPSTISIHANIAPTPTPYPDNTFVLTASYYPPTSDNLDIKFISTNIDSHNIEAIAWFIDNKFYKSYYRTTPEDNWKEHFSGADPITDKIIKDPYDFSGWEKNAANHEISAKVYGFNKNENGGQVWLGDTNNIKLVQ